MDPYRPACLHPRLAHHKPSVIILLGVSSGPGASLWGPLFLIFEMSAEIAAVHVEVRTCSCFRGGDCLSGVAGRVLHCVHHALMPSVKIL